ncbi:hypothetical protein G4D82_00185 [Flavobacterium sp. CYK-4]|uniref:hypothetical protein n=1 Tax=Flavobacterium lotistagni TaxID=2709660 RepID=UPI00140D470A|nr:hypothetical protein [Flavobacterium lotistagni]NHM05625.1 hypothetical protein [Flavobacterium lotistagni]
MKNLVVLIALALFLKPVFPVMEYVLNYDYITKTLCVNKAKPQMHCNGKCHLMKELAKAAEAEKPLSSDKKDHAKSAIEELFFQDITPLTPSFIYSANTKVAKTSYRNLYCYQFDGAIFHPPTFNA